MPPWPSTICRLTDNPSPAPPVPALVEKNGVKIVGTTNLPALVAPDASALYARNVLNFLALSLNLKTGEFKIARDDEIVQAPLICDGGQVVTKK